MSLKMRKVFVSCVFSLFLILSVVTAAQAYSSIFAFGDSLSDNGTVDGVGFTRMSDGPVWVDYLAYDYGLTESYINFAFSGATSYYNNPVGGAYSPALANTGLLSQVQMIGAIDGNALVAVWAGGNDMLNYASDPDLYNPVLAAARVGEAVGVLVEKGARNFIVPNLSYNYIDDPATAYWMQVFNLSLSQVLLGLEQIEGVNIYGIDLTQLWYIDLDLSDTITGAGSIIGPDGLAYANYDSVHPSSAAHRQIANYVKTQVQVPEPASLVLLLVGFAGLAGMRRKMK